MNTDQPYKLTTKELETHFDLNTYDFGARQFDMTIGRWNSLDALAEKYYSFSPFAYCGNNPAMFVDPDGKKIVIGSEKQSYVLAQAQKLTNDRLAINPQNGEVYIKQAATGKMSKPEGTQLIRAIIDKNYTATINYSATSVGSGTNYTNDKGSYNDGGTDVDITLSDQNGSSQYIVNGKTVDMSQKLYIVLGGELIHALVAMDGHKDQTGDGSHTYTNIYGDKQTETRSKNELAAHGMAGWLAL